MKFFKKRPHFSLNDSLPQTDFWLNTNFKNRKANAYDTVDLVNPNGYENFLKDFYPFNYQYHDNQPYQALPSKINPELLVTSNQWVVSLLRKGDHAVIALETVGYGKDEGLCLRWFDFLPKNKPNAPRSCYGVLTNFKALENEKVLGMVRYCPTNLQQPLLNIPSDITKHNLFTKLHWNEDSDSWTCTPLAVKTMIDDIGEDFKLSNQDKLQFKFCGHIIPNCTSWTWRKLASAGIDARNHHFQNKFIIRASKNVGSKRHHKPIMSYAHRKGYAT